MLLCLDAGNIQLFNYLVVIMLFIAFFILIMLTFAFWLFKDLRKLRLEVSLWHNTSIFVNYIVLVLILNIEYTNKYTNSTYFVILNYLLYSSNLSNKLWSLILIYSLFRSYNNEYKFEMSHKSFRLYYLVIAVIGPFLFCIPYIIVNLYDLDHNYFKPNKNICSYIILRNNSSFYKESIKLYNYNLLLYNFLYVIMLYYITYICIYITYKQYSQYYKIYVSIDKNNQALFNTKISINPNNYYNIVNNTKYNLTKFNIENYTSIVNLISVISVSLNIIIPFFFNTKDITVVNYIFNCISCIEGVSMVIIQLLNTELYDAIVLSLQLLFERLKNKYLKKNNKELYNDDNKVYKLSNKSGNLSVISKNELLISKRKGSSNVQYN